MKNITQRELIKKACLWLGGKLDDSDIGEFKRYMLGLCKDASMDSEEALGYMKEFGAPVTYLSTSDKEKPPKIVLEGKVIAKYDWESGEYIKKQEWEESEFLGLINEFVLL